MTELKLAKADEYSTLAELSQAHDQAYGQGSFSGTWVHPDYRDVNLDDNGRGHGGYTHGQEHDNRSQDNNGRR